MKLILPSAIAMLLFFFTINDVKSQCINPTPIGNTVQDFCAVDAKKVSNLIATGGDVKWYLEPVSGVALDPSELLVNDIYYADDIVGGNCSTERLAVTVNVYGYPPSNVNLSINVCENNNPTISNLSATGTNIQWFLEETGGTVLASNTPINDGEVYWVQQTENGCTSYRLPTQVNFLNIDAPNITPTNLQQEFCSTDTVMVEDLVSDGENVVWYAAEHSTNPLDNDIFLIDGEDYWASKVFLGCESVNRTKVIVEIEIQQSAGSNTVFNECLKTLLAQPINLFDLLEGNPDINGVWSGPTNLSGGYLGTYTQGTNTPGEYTYTIPSELGVCLESSATFTLNALNIDAPTTTSSTQTFCLVTSPTISLLTATGNEIKWYESATSTTELPETTVLVDGETYYATQTDANTSCESVSRLAVSVVLNDIAAPTVSQTTQEFCEIEEATVASLQATGNDIKWYESATSTSELPETTSLIDGETYYATQTSASTGCESSTRTLVTVNIFQTPAPTTANATQTFCAIDEATISDIVISGNSIIWYATESSTTALNNSTLLVHGTEYWATQTDATTGCESKDRTAITIAINSVDAPTTSNQTQEFCEIEDATIASLQITGNGIKWYESETSTTELPTTTSLEDGETYYATQTDAANGCESETRLAITVTIHQTAAPVSTSLTQSFCLATSPTISALTATGNDIKWYESATSTTELPGTTVLVDGETYYATQTDVTTGCESVARLAILVVLNDIAAPTVSQTTQDFCEIEEATVASLQATGNDIKWYESATSTSELPETTSLGDGETYYASQTETSSGCESTNRTAVTVTILQTPAPTATDTTQTFCIEDATTLNDLIITGENIRWYASLTDNTVLDNTSQVTNNTTYFASQTLNSSNCESKERLAINVVVIDQEIPSTSNTNQVFCIGSQSTIEDIDISGNGIQWYADETSTTALNTNQLLEDGVSYYATQTGTTNGCESSNRLEITISFSSPEIPEIIEDGEKFCFKDTPIILDLSDNIVLEDNETIQWYLSFPGGQQLSDTDPLTDGETYLGIVVDDNNCESPSPISVTVDLTACPEGVIVYDGFSPNGDGVNDTFHIKNIKELYPDYTVEFFNRWGNKIYDTNANKPDWNGKLNGKGDVLPVGVYYFIINFNDGSRKPLQGRLYLNL